LSTYVVFLTETHYMLYNFYLYKLYYTDGKHAHIFFLTFICFWFTNTYAIINARTG